MRRCNYGATPRLHKLLVTRITDQIHKKNNEGDNIFFLIQEERTLQCNTIHILVESNKNWGQGRLL
jgi:hypothetical protein